MSFFLIPVLILSVTVVDVYWKQSICMDTYCSICIDIENPVNFESKDICEDWTRNM